jgi:hypothetical protein
VRPPIYRPVFRPWRHRPHFGAIIAGVTLGAVVTAAVAGSPPPPPSPELCWYWSDREERFGYWDYCN